MKVSRASETDIDRRLALDAGQAKEAFCRNFESDAEVPAGFYDLQDEIRKGLRKEFWEKYDDGKDRSKLKPWQLATSHELFFFPGDLINSERMIIELSSEILHDSLIGLILSYLEKFSPTYCVMVAVCSGRNMKGSNYIGRFVINLKEIAVEESLVEVWSQQVQFMEIEN